MNFTDFSSALTLFDGWASGRASGCKNEKYSVTHSKKIPPEILRCKADSM